MADLARSHAVVIGAGMAGLTAAQAISGHFGKVTIIERDALPAGAELELTAETGEPSLFPPDNRAIALSAQALERAVGTPTAFVRSGGSIPVVAEFAARDIPTVVSGFGLEDDAYHAPDESFRLAGLDQGAAAADELYRALAAL